MQNNLLLKGVLTMTVPKSVQSVQSVDRALSILEVLSNHDSLSLVEISKKVDLHKATTYRLVNSLLENEYVEKIEATKHYRISLKLFEIGNRRIQNISFLNVAKSMIHQLALEIDQTVHLVIEDKQEVLYIDKHDPENSSNYMESKIGKKASLYNTAVGKAILSTKTNEEIKKYWDNTEIRPITQHTITEFPKFINLIEDARENAFALDDEENEIGIVCIGSSFSSHDNHAAGAISISISSKDRDLIPEYAKKIKETTSKISRLLGGI
uniref:IclR family transcriptional regulator n=1 Tax=Carnobacterium sp. TaxID=48221 RepID=UPI00344B97FC